MIKTKNTGAYAGIVGMQHKKNGVCSAVAGCFTKVGGAYQGVLMPIATALRIAALSQRGPDNRGSASGYTRFTAEFPFQVDKPHSSITASFFNWAMTASYVVPTGGDVTIESFTVWVGSAAANPGFPSGPQLVMADKATNQLSNAIPASALGITSLVPGVNYWVKLSGYTPSGFIPRRPPEWLNNVAGVRFTFYDPTSTPLGNVTGPGAFTFGTATGLPVLTQSLGFYPFILGVPVDGVDDSFIVESDSNGAGTGDVARTSTTKGGGHADRALMDGARRIASINFSKANTTTANWTGSGMNEVRAYYVYTKSIYNRIGGNDFLDAATATTLANFKTNSTAMVNRYRAAGITKLVLGAMWTRSADTSGAPWTTLTNQIVAIGRESVSDLPPDGGLTLQGNIWLASLATNVGSMKISYVPYTSMRDAATNKWPITSVDGATIGIANTGDGTHATAVGHEKGGAELYPFLAS